MDAQSNPRIARNAFRASTDAQIRHTQRAQIYMSRKTAGETCENREK